MSRLHRWLAASFVTAVLFAGSTDAYAFGHAYCELAVVIQKLHSSGSFHKELTGRVVDIEPKKAWGDVECPQKGEQVFVQMDVPIVWVDEGDVIWFSYSYHQSRYGASDLEQWIPHFAARVGCGCATAPAAPSGWPLALLLVALVFRTRRRL